mgnify:CR=1 FL=1
MADRFAEVAAVADAVLHEGYLLYPYRASAQKNRVRWQWGVLMPQGYGTESGEASANRTECLVELRGELHVRVRWLHLERRTGRGEPYDEGTPGQADATFTRSQLLAGAEFGIVGDAAERGDGDAGPGRPRNRTSRCRRSPCRPPGRHRAKHRGHRGAPGDAGGDRSAAQETAHDQTRHPPPRGRRADQKDTHHLTTEHTESGTRLLPCCSFSAWTNDPSP